VRRMNQKYVEINYWKEIQGDIAKILGDLKGIVLLVHNSIMFKHIIDILNRIKSNQPSNVLYISLIRSQGYIKSTLDFRPLEQKTISIIDCVSGYAFPDKDGTDGMMYHKPPQNLHELKQIINYGIDRYNPNIVVLDSLSHFINFSKTADEELNSLYEFLNMLKNNSLNDTQMAFVLLYDDKLGLLKNLPKEIADLILKIEIVEEESADTLTNKLEENAIVRIK